MLVGIAGEESEWLVFGAENVQPGKIGGEDEGRAIREDEHERHLPYDAYYGVEKVDAEECEDEESGGIFGEGLVEKWYRWRLIEEE